MNLHAWRSFFCFLVLLGRLSAGEWSHWAGVGGDLASDRSASVVIRSRRDEGGDQPDLGYRFVYELHNQSGTQRAKVTLYCPMQDPATRRWKEADRNTPTIVHDLPPLGTVTGSRYSPSERGFTFESDVKWPEEQAAEDEQKKKGDKPAGVSEVFAPKSDRSESDDEFEGVPLSDKVGLKKAVDKYMDPQARFRATIAFHIPPGETSWMALVDDVGVDQHGSWRQYLDYWFSFVQRRTVVNERSYGYNLQIVSVTDSEMVVKFEDLIVDHLSIYLDPDPNFTWHETDPIVLELARLDPKAPSIQTEFEGVPLSDRAAVEQVVRKYGMMDDEDFTYRATLVFQIPPGRTEWVSYLNGDEVDRSGTWRERMEDWFAYVQQPLIIDGRDHSYQAKVISVTGSEMVVEFDRMPKDQMVRYLTTDAGWAANHHTVIRKMAMIRKR